MAILTCSWVNESKIMLYILYLNIVDRYVAVLYHSYYYSVILIWGHYYYYVYTRLDYRLLFCAEPAVNQSQRLKLKCL